MRWAIHYMRHALATLRALSSAIHKDQSRRQVWAKGLSPLHNCLASTVKHTGQESGSELCEICKHWSFLKSKSVNNVCLSASASRRLDPLPGLRPWTPLGDFPKFVIVVFIIVGPLNSVLTVHIIWLLRFSSNPTPLALRRCVRPAPRSGPISIVPQCLLAVVRWRHWIMMIIRWYHPPVLRDISYCCAWPFQPPYWSCAQHTLLRY